MSSISGRQRRTARVRFRLRAMDKFDKLRVSVFRSVRAIYGQVIARDGQVMASYSSHKVKDSTSSLPREVALKVGEELGKLSKKYVSIGFVYDRSCYQYAGRVANFFEGFKKGLDVGGR